MSRTTYSLSDLVPLSSGHSIPRLGFGVYKSPASQTIASVNEALKVGYRHIDSAQYYENEREVGQAVQDASLPRESLFVTTKIMSPGESGPASTLAKARESFDRFGLDYLDLFLIHSPSSGPEGRKEMWAALERLWEEGKVRTLGVSNFGVRHIEELKKVAKAPMAVNQIELHPWCQQREIVEYCKKEGIVIEAYCPLVRARKAEDPVLQRISKEVNRPWSQVLLRWSLQHGFVPLPKSDSPERIAANADIYDFALSEAQMADLDKLDEGKKGAIAPNPVDCE